MSIYRLKPRTPAEKLAALAGLHPVLSFAEYWLFFMKTLKYTDRKEALDDYNRKRNLASVNERMSAFGVFIATYRRLSSVPDLKDQAVFDGCVAVVQDHVDHRPQGVKRSVITRTAMIRTRQARKKLANAPMVVRTRAGQEIPSTELVLNEPEVKTSFDDGIIAIDYPYDPELDMRDVYVNTNRITDMRKLKPSKKEEGLSSHESKREALKRERSAKAEAFEQDRSRSKTKSSGRSDKTKVFIHEKEKKKLRERAARSQGMSNALTGVVESINLLMGGHGRKVTITILHVVAFLTSPSKIAKSSLIASLALVLEIDKNPLIRSTIELFVRSLSKLSTFFTEGYELLAELFGLKTEDADQSRPQPPRPVLHYVPGHSETKEEVDAMRECGAPIVAACVNKVRTSTGLEATKLQETLERVRRMAPQDASQITPAQLEAFQSGFDASMQESYIASSSGVGVEHVEPPPHPTFAEVVRGAQPTTAPTEPVLIPPRDIEDDIAHSQGMTYAPGNPTDDSIPPRDWPDYSWSEYPVRDLAIHMAHTLGGSMFDYVVDAYHYVLNRRKDSSMRPLILDDRRDSVIHVYQPYDARIEDSYLQAIVPPIPSLEPSPIVSDDSYSTCSEGEDDWSDQAESSRTYPATSQGGNPDSQWMKIPLIVHDFTSSFYSMLATAAGFGDRNVDIEQRVRVFSSACSAVKGLKDVAILLFKIVKDFLNWCSVQITGYPVFDTRTYEIYRQIDAARSELAELTFITSNPRRTIAEADRFVTFYKKMCVLNSLVATCDQAEVPVRSFTAMMKDLNRLYPTILSSSSLAKERVEPVALCLVGESGVGKTTFCDFAMKYISKRLGLAPNMMAQALGAEFADEYVNQSHWRVDEFAASSDSPVVQAQAAELLTMINVAPRPLNMSKVEMKGIVYDTSLFYYITTNTSKGEWKKFLRCPEALERRFHFTKHLCPNPEFYDYALKSWKVDNQGRPRRPLLPSGAIDWREYKLSDNFDWNCVSAKPVQEILDAMISLHLDHKRHSDVRSTDFEAMLAEMQMDAPVIAQDGKLTLDSPVVFNRVKERFVGIRATPATLLDVIPEDEWIKHLFQDDDSIYRYLPGLGDLDSRDNAPALIAILDVYYNFPNLVNLLASREAQPAPPTPPEAPPLWKRVYRAVIGAATGAAIAFAARYIVASGTSIVINICKAIGAIALLIGGITLLWKAVTAVSSKQLKDQIAVAQSNVKYSGKGIHETRMHRASRGNYKVARVQGGDTVDADLTSNYARNCVVLEVGGGLLKGVGVRGRHVLINHHNLAAVLGKPSFLLHLPVSGTLEISVADCQISACEGADIALITMPIKCPEFKDIYKHFIDEDDIPHLGGVYHKLRLRKGQVPVVEERFSPSGATALIYYDAASQEAYHPIGVILDIPGRAGDCGEPAFCYNAHLSSRNFVGIHCAGTEYSSQITIVSKQLLDELFPTAEAQGLTLVVDGPIKFPIHTLPETATVVGRAKYPSSPGKKSKLVKTPFYGQFAVPIREPAALDRKNGVSPLEEAYKRQKFSQITMPDKFLDDAASLQFRSLKAPCKRALLDDHQVYNGCPGLRGIDMSTSPSHPYVRLPGYNPALGKSQLFEGEPGNYIPKPVVTQYTDAMFKYCLTGDGSHDAIFTDSLKDEIVSKPKTRLFAAAPLHVVIVGRKLFGAWIAALNYSRQAIPGSSTCAVGMDVNGAEAQRLYVASSAPHTRILVTDQKAFDSHEQYFIAKKSCESINRWYNDEYSEARLRYIDLTYHAYHIVGDVIYQLAQGMPSGSPLTAQFNSTYLETATLASLSYATYLHHQEDETVPYMRCREIARRWYALFYGDDSWVVVPDHPSFTYARLNAAYQACGLEATYAAKSETDLEYSTLEDATFLKRKFVSDSGTPRLALPIELIYDVPNYALKRSNNTTTYASMFNSMLLEISAYGQEAHAKLVSEIHEVMQKTCMFLYTPPTYDECLHTILSTLTE